MGKVTKIEWADSTLNLWFGCTKVSEACTNCYAEAWSKRSALVTWGPGQPRVQAKHWRAELEAISRAAKAAGRPWFVFVNSLSDFFDNEVDDAWRAEALAAFRQHRHLVLLLVTKRIGNADAMLARAGGLPPNCAVMITVIDQDEARRDVPKLLRLKAVRSPAFVGVSIEPMLGPIDLTDLDSMDVSGCERLDALGGIGKDFLGAPVRPIPRLDWVIVGFESGPRARPGHPEWARGPRDQCAAAGVAFLFKQWGEFAPVVEPDEGAKTVLMDSSGTVYDRPPESANDDDPFWTAWYMQKVGKKAAGRLLDGALHDARPELAA